MNNAVQLLIHFPIDMGSVSIKIRTVDVLTEYVLRVVLPT
jgi:hypothetical protein